jgi:hypothetical protein
MLIVLGVACLRSCLSPAASAEWLEDHTKTTFRLIKRGTIVCFSLQLLWLITDRQLFWPNLVGLVSHANSWLMLKRYYPNHMGLEQPPTIVALALLVVHQTTWVLTWAQDAGSLVNIAAILATVVWPIPIMLLLSAGTESDLPIRMPLSANGEAVKGSIPNSPLASSQPGSPFVDTARLRMRHSSNLQPRTDTAHQPDQAPGVASSIPLLSSVHSRKGSGGSGSENSFSSSMSAAWVFADRLQQQPGFRKHRSRLVQAMHKLQELAGVQSPGAVLPVADSHKR